MRITGITTHAVGTPRRNLTYVLVHTDEGLTGVGETRTLGHTDALVGYLREAEANHIAGSDPFAVEDLVRRMRYGDFGRAGEIVMSGIAVVETACWGIKGKALGVPVRQLLGGKVTDRVKAYANGRYTTERTPEVYHAAARACPVPRPPPRAEDPDGHATGTPTSRQQGPSARFPAAGAWRPFTTSRVRGPSPLVGRAALQSARGGSASRSSTRVRRVSGKYSAIASRIIASPSGSGVPHLSRVSRSGHRAYATQVPSSARWSREP